MNKAQRDMLLKVLSSGESKDFALVLTCPFYEKKWSLNRSEFLAMLKWGDEREVSAQQVGELLEVVRKQKEEIDALGRRLFEESVREILVEPKDIIEETEESPVKE